MMCKAKETAMYGHTDKSGIPTINKIGKAKTLPVKFIRDVSNGLSGDNLISVFQNACNKAPNRTTRKIVVLKSNFYFLEIHLLKSAH